jgi:hypothetical protein
MLPNLQKVEFSTLNFLGFRLRVLSFQIGNDVMLRKIPMKSRLSQAKSQDGIPNTLPDVSLCVGSALTR